jgi:hypothetical protein
MMVNQPSPVPEHSGETSVTELLDTLNTSENMAKVVERRLDEVLGNLDALLATLEGYPEQSNQHSAGRNADRGLEEKK